MMNFFVMGLGAVLVATLLLAGRTRRDAPGYRGVQAWGERKRRRGFKAASRKAGTVVRYSSGLYRVMGNGSMYRMNEERDQRDGGDAR